MTKQTRVRLYSRPSIAIVSLLLAGLSSVAASAQTATAPPPTPSPAVEPQADASVAPAQSTVSASQSEGTDGATDIVVTARRRNEQSLDVPVVITAFSGDQLNKAGVINLADIGKLTPQLTIDRNVAAFGGTITLRGVVSPTGIVTAEPAVTINIDGMPLSFGAVTQLGQFDLGQVEILKGPQALFFGKNASAGIISIRTADPTNEFETRFRAEYETKAIEPAVEAMMSGPISGDLLGRIAIRYSSQSGYFYNLAPNATNRRGPGTEEFGARGTVIYEPSDKLKIRLKASYDSTNDVGVYIIAQRIFCPTGKPQGAASSPAVTDCSANTTSARADLPPGIATISNDPLYRDGVPYSYVKQGLGILDIAYNVAPGVALNSITGFFKVTSQFADSQSNGVVSLSNLDGRDVKRTFNQEIRLSSDGKSSFSWMLGGLFQDDHLYDQQDLVTFAPPSTFGPASISKWNIEARTYSAFAQISYDFTPQLNFSGGGRYTHERKTQVSNLSNKFIPAIEFNNFSPEATLSFKPDKNVNIFASYKQGYMSGNFQTGRAFAALIANPAITTINNFFRDETAKGGEIGMKAELMSGQLRVNTAAYRYIYKDLQISGFDPTTLIIRVTNAASAVIKGAEGDFTFAPRGVPGLTINGALSFNLARYRDFNASCYVGQTRANGCTIDGPDPDTTPDLQKLSGRTLPRAPKWSWNLGANYSKTFANLRFDLGGMATYQTTTYLSQELIPGGQRKGGFVFDANVALGSSNRAWEVAIVGKNLANRYYGTLGSQVAGTGSATTTGTTGVGQRSDFSAQVNRGREIWLRVTFRPERF